MERVYKIALFVTLIIFGGVVVALLVTPEPREFEKKPVETSSSTGWSWSRALARSVRMVTTSPT